MSITRGQVWSGFDNSASGSVVINSGSVDIAAASLVVLQIAYRQNQTTPVVSSVTPQSWTKLIFHDADYYVYVLTGGIAINHTSGITVNLASSDTVVRSCIVTEYKTSNGNGWTLSQDPAVVSQGTASTTPTTNAITTSGASSGTNIVCVSGFSQFRGTTTAPVFSSPTNSYLSAATVSQNDGSTSLSHGVYDKIITTDVSSQTSGVTSNVSLAYSAAVIAYIENAATTWQPYTRNDRFDSMIQQANFNYESRRAMIFLPTGTTPTTWIPLSRKGSWEDIPDDWDD